MGFTSLLAGQLRQGSTFLLGTSGESAILFGQPPPDLPPGDRDAAGLERIAVETSVPLREALARWLAAAARSLVPGRGGMPAAGSSDADAERDYHDKLLETLRVLYAADRRQGIVNLFWLAHSREIVEAFERFSDVPSPVPHLVYRLHPLIAGILRRADEGSRVTGAGRPQRALQEFRRGAGLNNALVQSIIGDQLTLTEPDPRAFDPTQVLVPENGRFRIGAAAFIEIRDLLRERFAAAVAGAERWTRSLLQDCPVAFPGAGKPPDTWDRFIFADPVREYLFQDLEGVGSRLQRSRLLRNAVSREHSWSDLLGEYAEVTRCVRRAEAVAALRRALEFTNRSIEHQETRERFLEGRLFRLGSTDAVQSGVRTATILFADIRGFTRASEGAVSEGDLIRELYEIFDPAALIVRRFGGAIDKYLGDGFMATFTGGSRPGAEALAAVRTAVALQQVLGKLRHLGRTTFYMGISLHLGRVAVARFLRDEQHSEVTIIGRQVNIAGRLSDSDGELPSGSGTPGSQRVGDVAIDETGHLVNHGIAVSGPLLAALRQQVTAEPFNENGVEGVRWYDHELALWLHFGYAGELRFRGLEAAIPVYSLVSTTPAPASVP